MAVEETPKARLAAFYSRVAPLYEAQGPPRFRAAGRRLVALAAVRAGDRVLDVATGRGAVLFAAAERVGPMGRVLGVDVAPGMVEHTRAAIAARHLGNADVQLMDAEQLDVEDRAFTHVLCSYAVFFFPDVGRVLAELWRVLVPGGTVGFAFERGGDPRWEWYEALLAEAGLLAGLPSMPGSDQVRRPGALEQAAFGQVQEHVEEVELYYAGADAWWASLWTHGSRRPLERLSAEQVADLRRVCVARAGQLAGPHGVPEVHRFVFVLGCRPA
jgi:O-methyltransferase/aklanonic acid methyltransferase